MKAYRLETISRIISVSSSLDADKMLGNEPPCPCSRYRDRYPAIEQYPRNLADQCSSMIDQPLPRAVKRLDVLLLQSLLRHEPHVPLLYRGADRLGVIAVVLLPADEWLHVLRGLIFTA